MEKCRIPTRFLFRNSARHYTALISFGSADLYQKKKEYILAAMINSRFATWLRKNAGPEKEASAAVLSVNFSNILMSTTLWHVGFKYLHFHLQSEISFKNGKRSKGDS